MQGEDSPEAKELRTMNLKMTEGRQSQINLIAAKYSLSSEEYVQAVITAALLSEAQADETVRLMLARVGGASWQKIVELARHGQES